MPYRSAIVSEKGLRSHMEDRHVLQLDFGDRGWVFGGVYDGHGGAAAAQYAAAHLHERFLALLSHHHPQKAFLQSYQPVAEEIRDPLSGACATNFFIRDGQIFYANAGDARIIVVSEDGENQLTRDHRLDIKEERERITKMEGLINGPYFFRDDCGLMPTRSLGDRYFWPVGLIPTPDVGSHKILPKDLFLVAATDGLFDVMENHEIGTLARKNRDPHQLAILLKEETLVTRNGRDNLTILILALS